MPQRKSVWMIETNASFCLLAVNFIELDSTMSLNFLNRIEPGQSEKFKLNSINFKGSVQHLKDGISKKIKRNANDFGE